MESTIDKAWACFEKGEIEQADSLYQKLLKKKHKPDVLEMIKHQYGYVLVTMQRFSDAEKLYEELYNQTENHIYLHQMGYVARESNHLEKALDIFVKERDLITGEGPIAASACNYELAFISLLMGKIEDARGYASLCLQEAKDSKDSMTLACAHRINGDIMTRIDKSEAIDHYNQSIEFFEKSGDVRGVSVVGEILRLLTGKSDQE